MVQGQARGGSGQDDDGLGDPGGPEQDQSGGRDRASLEVDDGAAAQPKATTMRKEGRMKARPARVAPAMRSWT